MVVLVHTRVMWVRVQWRSSCFSVYELHLWSGRWGAVHWTPCLVLRRSTVAVKRDTGHMRSHFSSLTSACVFICTWTHLSSTHSHPEHTPALYDHTDDKSLTSATGRMCFRVQVWLLRKSVEIYFLEQWGFESSEPISALMLTLFLELDTINT